MSRLNRILARAWRSRSGGQSGGDGAARRRVRSGRDAARRAWLRRSGQLAGWGLAWEVLQHWPSLVPAARAADGIEVGGIRLEPGPEGDSWQLSADFQVNLPSGLTEAINRGLTLAFIVEVDLYEPRWYWWDDKVVSASQVYRLSYHALTRQYRLVSSGAVPAQTFLDLSEALHGLGTLRGWRIADVDRFRYGTTYEGQLRMRLDAGQLPKPFQLTAITNKDWNLQAEWKRFEFKP